MNRDQVCRLVLSTIITESTDAMPEQSKEGVVALIRSNWELGSQMLADMGNRSLHPEVAIEIAESHRRNTGPEAVASMLVDLYETVHLRDELSDLTMPTLILHRREQTPWLFSAATHAAAVILNARLVPLPGSGSTSLGPDAEANTRIIAAFLDEDPETRALPTPAPASQVTTGGFRTVLFTDLVGHTEMMSRLGDAKGRDVLREHERITREVLKAHGGTEVKTMGDGFLASFGSVVKAVECAVALQKAFDVHNRGVGQGAASSAPTEALSVRVGLNAGEPIEEDGDLFGSTVILASRIAAAAQGGEILASMAVRELCAGKGFAFADRGEFVVKGFEEPVRMFEVSWRS